MGGSNQDRRSLTDKAARKRARYMADNGIKKPRTKRERIRLERIFQKLGWWGGIMNSVKLSGNLVRDPEKMTLSTGTVKCTFTLLVVSGKADRRTNNYFDCVAWKDVAERVCAFRKGDRIAIDGMLTQRRWETPEGGKRSKVEVVAFDVAPADQAGAFAGPSRRETSPTPENDGVVDPF